MKYHKAGSAYVRISYESEFLMLLQAAKQIANVRFNSVVHDNRCPDRDILINRLCIRILLPQSGTEAEEIAFIILYSGI